MDRKELQEILDRIDKLEDYIETRKVGGLTKIWDILVKLTVPVMLAIGTAIIVHEVRLGKIEQSVAVNKENIVTRAPVTVSKNIEEIKSSIDLVEDKLDNVRDRLARIETKLEAHVPHKLP